MRGTVLQYCNFIVVNVIIKITNAISKRISLTKFGNLNMLPQGTIISKNHFHKECTCFTSKKCKVAVL